MGRHNQLLISRFFAPKQNSPAATSTPVVSPPPKIAATVSFSPAKRLRTSQIISARTKVPKITHHTLGETHSDLPLSDPSLHQKFLNKLLEPSQDLFELSGNHNPHSSITDYTPLEQQVVELKKRHPDVLLMIEVGYRYRFFGEDAENAARVLGIYAHMDHNFLTASVPTFRLNFHVRRLVNAGYKVGVVKQTETAAIKAHGSNKLGPFCRGLSALYTKATLEAAEDMGGQVERGSSSSYLFCVVEKAAKNVEGGVDVRIGAVGVEISTGDVVYGEFEDNFMRTGLETMTMNLCPAELLLGKPLSKQTEKLLLAYAGPASRVRVENTSNDYLCSGGALAEVMSLCENFNDSMLPDCLAEKLMEIEPLGNNGMAIEGIMSLPDLAVQALALTIRHLKQFGLERILCFQASFRPFSCSMEMTLSANTLQQLEVLKNNSDGSDNGSLLQCMNHTLTIFGSRLFRHWVTHPLCHRTMINDRLDAVSEILESMGSSKTSETVDFDAECSGITLVQPEIYHVISSVLTALGRGPDIQRGITRIFHQTATASEFIAVIEAVVVSGKQLRRLHIKENDENNVVPARTVHSVLLRKLISAASSSSVIGIAEKLLTALNKEAANQRDLHNLFNISDGKFSEIATARMKVHLTNEKLEELKSKYREQMQMSNLDFIIVSGLTHLIEMPSDLKVPSDWIRVNSTKRMTRYRTPEVLKGLDELCLANEELSVVCRAAWDSFLKTFGGFYSEFQTAVHALAALDCLYSLAMLSRTKNYIRPIFIDDDEPVQINICSGRHPVMENILQESYVPNDTNLHVNGQYCQIVTGPNMGGKSSYIRQVALIALMAHVGSFVPASSVELHVLDDIYTRMGASDCLQLGKSTFLEELSEASSILQCCTPRSLVIIDELGRGTSTHDGVAIAYATLHHLLEHKKCMLLFVTHYPKLVDIKKEFPKSVGAYFVSYLTPQKEINLDTNSDQVINSATRDDVTYLYKLVPGIAERSFGFKVALLAQLPSSCIRRAVTMAARLEQDMFRREKNKLLMDCSRELLSYDKAEFINEDVSVSRIWSQTDKVNFENVCRDLFVNLDKAFKEENRAEKLHVLKHAQDVAIQVLNAGLGN